MLLTAIEIDNNKLSIDKAKSLLDAFVSAWIDRDLVDEEKTKRELAINRPALQNSLGCLYLLLIDIFLSVHLYAQPSDVQVNSFLEEIENYLPLFSQDEQALISFLKGFEVMKKKKYQAALDHYEKALRILVFRLNDILNNRIFDFPLDPEGFKLFRKLIL